MKTKRIVSIILIITLMCTTWIIFSFNNVYSFDLIRNPKMLKAEAPWDNLWEYDYVTTWDCVYFGNYYQNNYEKKEPIKWRVLSVNNDEALLLSDKALDCKPYNTERERVDWGSCSLRKWLNNEFLDIAFNQHEEESILYTSVDYVDKQSISTQSQDRVYLLSSEEAQNTNYGFLPKDGATYTRSCQATKYAEKQGVQVFEDEVWWWLRTLEPAEKVFPYDDYAFIAEGVSGDDGWIGGGFVDYSNRAIRPVIRIDLSSDTWDYAGRVSSKGKVIDDCRTSTSSILEKTSTEIIDSFSTVLNDYEKTINKKKDVIIPGLEQTNQTVGDKTDACQNMVPQGVCVTDKYILISAYDGSIEKHTNHSSVIYVKDRKSGEYLKTLILRDAGHVGALAWDGKGTVYISGNDTINDDNTVYTIKTSEIDSSADDDAVGIPVAEIKVPLHPTFLAYKGGYLYIGQMGNTKNGSNVVMAKCNTNGKQVGLLNFSMPNKTQGVSIVQGVDGKNYLIASISLGRKEGSTAELRVYELNLGSYLMKYQTPNKTIKVPYMNEDVDINNGMLYTCYESAANNYRNNLDGKGFGASPQVDRVLVSYAQKILGVKTKTKSSKSKDVFDDSIEEIESGKCGDNSTYSVYDNGSLVISGFGDISDYSSSSETPWSSYSNQIKNIVIGADISSIGKNAFSNLTNLKEVTFSQMLNDQETFSIGDYAFGNCTNLESVSMPDVDYNISSTAFNGCNKLQIKTDSESVTNYCDARSINIHNHNFEYKSTVAPTCLDDGYDIYECDCGEEDLRNIKQATDNHSYKVTDSYGKINIYTCEKCGSQYEEEVEEKPTEKKDATNKTTPSNKTTPKNNKKTSIKKIKVKKKSLKLTWKKVKGVNGYQIKYSLKKNFKKSKMITIRKASIGSKTIKKLKPKKKYYLKVRTYIIYSGTNVYSGWSKTKSKKTK